MNARRTERVEREWLERLAHIVGGASAAAAALRHADAHIARHPGCDVAFMRHGNTIIVRTCNEVPDEPPPTGKHG